MKPGERQTASTLDGIRQDHIQRYRLAAQYISPNHRVLDAACGTGYGSYLVAREAAPQSIIAVDRSIEAINHGKRYFFDKRISYDARDIYELKNLPPESVDVICSLETLEHLEKDSEFLDILYGILHPGGLLIISTPNQDVMPFDKESFPFHCRHYTSENFICLLKQHGFIIHRGHTQVKDHVLEGFGGRFNIAVCQKAPGTPAPGNLIKPYLQLLQEVEMTQEFFTDFGGSEARRMLEIGRTSEALWLSQKWTEYNEPEAWYFLGYLHEKTGNLPEAVHAYKKVLQPPLIPANKKFTVSALFHLAALSTNEKEKKEFLQQCLTLEPNHQKAKALTSQNN